MPITVADSILYLIQWITFIICVTYVLAALAQTTDFNSWLEKSNKRRPQSVVATLSLLIALAFIVRGISNLGNYTDLVVVSTTESGAGPDAMIFRLTVLLTFSTFLCAFSRSMYTVSMLDTGAWWQIENFGEQRQKSSINLRTTELLLRASVLLVFMLHQVSLNRLSTLVTNDARAEGVPLFIYVRQLTDSISLVKHSRELLFTVGAISSPLYESPSSYRFTVPPNAYDLSQQQILDVQRLISPLALTTVLVAALLLAWAYVARKILVRTSAYDQLAKEQYRSQVIAFGCLTGVSFWLVSFATLEIDITGTLASTDVFGIITFVGLLSAILFSIYCLAPQVCALVIGAFRLTRNRLLAEET